MAKTPGDANLGAAGAHLLEFSHKMQQRAAQEKRLPGQGDPVALVARVRSVGHRTPCYAGRCSRRSKAKAASRMLRKELVSTQDGITIRYTGAQLDQADLDVWEQALHLARTQALGTKCYFTAHGFLKALGRQTGKSGHKWLAEALARLSATSVEITAGRRTYFGSLIEEGMRDEETGRYVVEINPKLARFYGRSQWTQIDWEQRQALRRKPLALWLHGFYASHAKPYPLRVGLSAQAQRQPDQAAPEVQTGSEPRRWVSLSPWERSRRLRL